MMSLEEFKKNVDALIVAARKEGAEDMRERAAKEIEAVLARTGWKVGFTDFRSQHIDCRESLAAAIRALPLDERG